MKTIVGLLLLGAAATAGARPIPVSEAFSTPGPIGYEIFQAAVEGDWMVLTAHYNFSAAGVFLYRRPGFTGQWVLQSRLIEVAYEFDSEIYGGAPIALENRIIATVLAGKLYVFERGSAGWTRSTVVDDGAPLVSFPVQIDGLRIMVATGNCGSAAVFEKRADGAWAISGRLTAISSGCVNRRLAAFDLSGNYAATTVFEGDPYSPSAGRSMQAFRRIPGQVEWAPVATLPANFGRSPGAGTIAMRGSIALLSSPEVGTQVFHRTDASGSQWNLTNTAIPLDFYNPMISNPGGMRQRGDMLFVDDEVFRQRADYTFEHVAHLEFTAGGDVYQRTVVVPRGSFVQTYLLPETFGTASAVRDDFEGTGNSNWETAGQAQFMIAQQGFTHVYRQTSTVGEASAEVANSDWPNQSIDADLTITQFAAAGSWAGPSVRRQSNGDGYYLKFWQDGGLQMFKRLNGVETLISNAGLIPVTVGTPIRVRMEARDDTLLVFVDGERRILAFDRNSLTHGAAGFTTYRTRIDVDNVVVSPLATELFGTSQLGIYGRWVVRGGNWSDQEVGGVRQRRQLSRSGNAHSIIPISVGDQVVEAHLKIDAAGASGPGCVGVVGRYFDRANTYFAALCSSNTLQIRKRVNGVEQILRSVPFALTPSQQYLVRLDVTGNRLHAFVDGVFLAEVSDDSLTRGRFGIATSNAAGTFLQMYVYQP